MTTFSETVVQQSKLIGRLILNRYTAEEMGRVNQFWLDTSNHRVVAMSCKSGFLGRNIQFFRWEQIEAIGKDSILLSILTEPLIAKPDSTDLVVGHELWTDAGNKAGSITDYCLDPKTGVVVAYLFVSNGWQGLTDGTYLLLPQAVMSLGAKRLIAQAEQVQNAEQFSAGLSDKMAQAAEFLKEDYAQTRRDIAAVVESSQTTASQLQETTQQVAGQTQIKLTEVGGKVQQTTQQIAAQAQTKLTDVTGQLQDTAQTMAAQVKQKAATIQTQLETNRASTTEENLPEVSSSVVKKEIIEFETPKSPDEQDASSS